MFVNNILSNWEWDLYIHPCTQDLSSSPTGLYIYIYISKLKYVLCQLHFAQILAGEGEKTLFSSFQ